MAMTERVKNLREQSLAAPASISIDRARLVTEFTRQNNGLLFHRPVFRAQLVCLSACSRKISYFGEDELIVGEKGHAPKAAPDLPRIVLPQPGGPGNTQRAREDPLRGQRGSTPGVRG